MATLVIGLAVAYIAGRLLAPKPPKPQVDRSSPILHERGSYTSWVIGRRRVGHIVAWVGNRRSETRSSGGGKGGGGKKQKYNVYYEEAWHLICVGPVRKLHAIYVSGKVSSLLAAPIDRDTYPSGSFIDLGDGQGFHIYWGECDQQVNTLLSARLPGAPASAWPGCCYVLWDDFFLGQTAAWPSIEYEVETAMDGLTPLQDSEADLTGAGYSGSLALDASNVGPNLGHVLYYIHTAPYPFGAGEDPATVDLGAYELLGVQAEAQHLPVNLLAPEGDTAQQVISDILQDQGVALPVVEGVIRPVLVREDLTPVVLTSGIVDVDAIERTVAIEKTVMERVIYRFVNVDNAFAAQDISVDDDSGDAIRFKRTERVINLPTVNHPQAASWAADRKQREALVGSDQIVFRAFREGARLVSGEACQLPDGRKIRVLAVTRHALEDSAEIEALPDIYAKSSSTPFELDPDYTELPGDGVLESDEFSWQEATPANGIAVGDFLTWRANAAVGVLGASSHASADNVGYSFAEAASENGCVGYIIDPILSDTDTDLTTGPKFRITTGDSSAFLDLTGSPTLWEAGDQKVLIDDEIFYLEGITVLGVGLYRFEGMKRGRDATPTNKHLAFSKFYFQQRTDMAVNNNAVVQPGTTVYVKTQPYNATQSLPLSSVLPVSKPVYGALAAPLPSVDVSANGATNEYAPAGDVVLDWTAETSIPEVPSLALDDFEILIYAADRTTVLRTINITSPVSGANTTTYTNANIVSDFGSEPDKIWIRITAKSGSYRSLPSWLEVRKQGIMPALASLKVLEAQTFGLESQRLDEQLQLSIFL